MKLCCTVVLILGAFVTPAVAQKPADDARPTRLIISDRAIALALRADLHPHPAYDSQSTRPSGRDSVKNGALIGAVVGGLAMGGLTGWICNMLREPGNPSCWPGVAVWTGLGAAAGAGAGAGIDALISRSPGGAPASAARLRRD